MDDGRSTDSQIDNLLFNQGLPTPEDIAARTTTIDLDSTMDQNGADVDDAGVFLAAACGDFNGDGYVDLVCSTDRDAAAAGGEDDSDGRVGLFYHLGGTGGLSNDDRTDYLDDPWSENGADTGVDNSIYIQRSEDTSDAGWLFGYSLVMGDFSGGSYDDLIIGAPLEDTLNNASGDANYNPGTVYVIRGSGTLIAANVTVANPGTPGANEIDQVLLDLLLVSKRLIVLEMKQYHIVVEDNIGSEECRIFDDPNFDVVTFFKDVTSPCS